MTKFGIDISRHNGNFDLARAKSEGVEFVILKGGGGDAGLYTDAKFKENYETCKKLGLPVGVYFYSRALTTEKAAAEANYFYENCLIGRQFELPVYIDVEEKAQFDLGRKALTDIVVKWCELIEAKGYFTGIYSNRYGFETYMDNSRLARFTHWTAAWNKTRPDGDMWQFGGETNLLRSTKVAGVTCDQNYLYTDLEAVIKEKGFNGFTAGKPSQDGTVFRVQTGSFTVKENAEEYAEKLKAAGFDAFVVSSVPGDVDGDGLITPEDARIVLRRSVGLE